MKDNNEKNIYPFKASLFGNITFDVVAENDKEAERIFNDTMQSITVRELKEKKTSREDVTIKDSELQINFGRDNKYRYKGER